MAHEHEIFRFNHIISIYEQENYDKIFVNYYYGYVFLLQEKG